MFQAIQTKYLPATTSRGSRIKASCEGGSVTIAYDYRPNSRVDNHIAAARALVEKMGWTPDQGASFAGEWIGGGTPSGYVFVFRNSASVAFTLA